MSDQGQVYFIACTETNRVKIGFTRGDPIARLRALQTGSAGQLRLMCARPGTPEMERDLHHRFRECNIHGEWFQPNDELVKHMLSIVFVEASYCARDGYEPDDWVIVGLRLLADEFGPLPDNLAALAGRGVLHEHR